MSIDDVDSHGLESLAKRWTPKGMRMDDESRSFMDSIAAALAQVMNPAAAAASYIPIILNPRRCRDDDLFRILDLNGIASRPGSISFDKLRRLAMLAPELRAWRGSFRAHRTVASAMSSGPVLVRTWIGLRTVLDESTFEVVLLDEDDANLTLIYLLTQGPDAAPDYSEDELVERVDSLAKPVLDDVELIDCFALTAWRNGIGAWGPGDGSDWPEAIQSAVEGEYESADVGPDVSDAASQFLLSPTLAPDPTLPNHSWLVSIDLATEGAADGDLWEVWAFSTGHPDSSPDAYSVKIGVGLNATIEFFRVDAGVPTSLGTHTIDMPDGAGSYLHLDLQVVRSDLLAARIRAYVNGDPTPWFDDGDSVGSRPDGRRLYVGCRPGYITQGRVRFAAITASFQEG